MKKLKMVAHTDGVVGTSTRVERGKHTHGEDDGVCVCMIWKECNCHVAMATHACPVHKIVEQRAKCPIAGRSLGKCVGIPPNIVWKMGHG